MRPSFRPTAPPPSESDSPPSAGLYDQEFLFHLYRGSELLQDNAVDEAKAELERALALQPRDVEGQSLLGIVYFRLGMYPTAIEIYERLERACPDDITPKINLSLCYLKTGQSEAARERLEAVVKSAPKHHRAWGYLGLVYQRFGEFEKAMTAFEHAGHPKMAERMALLISQVESAENSPMELSELNADPHAARRGSIRPSLGPTQLFPTIPPPASTPSLSFSSTAVPSPASLRQAPQPIEPSPLIELNPHIEPTPSIELGSPTELKQPSYPPASASQPLPSIRLTLPEPVARVARQAELIFPENPRVVQRDDGSVLVRVETSFAVRPQWIGALAHERIPFSTQTLRRRSGGSMLSEPLGGLAPLVSLVGSGRLLITARPDTRLVVFTVDREQLYLRESHLVGFEPQVSYDCGRLDPQHASEEAVTRLSGAGVVVIQVSGRIASLTVTAEAPVYAHGNQVIGWLGQLFPRFIPGKEAPAGLSTLLGFSGHGSVLVDLG